MYSSLMKFSGTPRRKKGFSDVEIYAANYIESVYGHSVCNFLKLNGSFPSRQTVARRIKE